jgi:hypothetical protein
MSRYFLTTLFSNTLNLFDISGFHGGENEDGCLLGCCAVWSSRSSPDVALMMEAASTTETSVNFYQTTRHNNPEDSHLHPQFMLFSQGAIQSFKVQKSTH